jgi:Protein of unknown function (DUF1552)
MAFNRRRFLMGIGGAIVGLPFLEGFSVRSAHAAAIPSYALFHRKGNGVQQAYGKNPNIQPNPYANNPARETERWWPTTFGPGAMNSAMLSAATTSAMSELGTYGSKMTIVRGLYHPYGTEVGHSEGYAQGLTGAGIKGPDLGKRSMGESLDGRIARELTPTSPDPLFMTTGRPENVSPSYRALRDIDPEVTVRRQGDNDLVGIFNRLFLPGLSDTQARELLQNQRKSVNDLVREDFALLLSDSRLSKSDKDRLDLHLSSIRDLEQVLQCSIPGSLQSDVANYQAVFATDNSGQAGNSIAQFGTTSAKLAVLAIACGASRSVLINLGNPQDDTTYRQVPGAEIDDFHNLSHRFKNDDAANPIGGAELLHHRIDRFHLQQFKKILDGLSAYAFADGSTLLDKGVCVHYSDLGTGYHNITQLPYLYAGGVDGALKTGQYIDVVSEPLVKFLNTIGAAVGLKNGSGAPLDDFNASNNGGKTGRLSALIA